MEQREAVQWAAWLVGLALLGSAIWYFSSTQRGLRLCDGAIQAQLKAPSTYNRVDYRAYGSDPSISITYEAENAFGVPLRSTGLCNLNADMTGATWTDYSAAAALRQERLNEGF